MTRVVVVEDHTLVRQSLMKTVEAEPGFEVVGEAGRGDDALGIIETTRPDVVLMDVNLPGSNGIEVATKVRTAAKRARVLFLTMHDDDATISRAIELGADGYVTKNASTEELLHALRTVAGGDSYLSPAVARRVMDLAGHRAHRIDLTRREMEILELLVSGIRPSEAARQLYLSVKTVKNHLTNIYAKLGVRSAVQAAAEAIRRGIVQAPTRN